MGPRKDLREIFTVKKRKNQRWEKIQVRTPNRTWTALNQGSVQSSAKWLNRTCGPVLGSPKKAENRTEPDFCNPSSGKVRNRATPVANINAMSNEAFDRGSFIQVSQTAWTDSDITSFVIEGNLQVTAELWVKRVKYL